MKQILKNISPFNSRTEMPEVLFVIKKILAFWLCYIAGLFIAEGAVMLLHFAVGKNIFAGEMFDTQTITLITYYGYIVMAGVALLYWKLVEKRPLSEMGITGCFSSYFIGVAAGMLLVIVSAAAIAVTGNIEYHGIFEKVDVLMIILLSGGFIIQGATEEIMCRGVVFHSLKDKTSVAVAMNVSTVMFMIPHLSSLFSGNVIYSVAGIINLILISTVFSLLTIRFQNIWAACGLHSFWNAVLYSVLGLNLSGNEGGVTAVFDMRSVGCNAWNGGEYGIEASVITTVVLAAAVIMIWHLNRRKISRP